MAAGGLPLVADSRGLREAGGEVALRLLISPILSSLLELPADPHSRAWIQKSLAARTKRRLDRLSPDLGLVRPGPPLSKECSVLMPWIW